MKSWIVFLLTATGLAVVALPVATAFESNAINVTSFVTVPPQVCPSPWDFEEDAGGNALAAGTRVDDEWAPFGILVSVVPGGPVPPEHPAMIFDSSNPSGGDLDLGAPNETFGGPGVGIGGEMGLPGANAVPLGNILIISEDNDSTDPDDDAKGGTIMFTFATPVDIPSVDILDSDDGNPGGWVRGYDASDTLVGLGDIVAYGDNSFQTIPLDATNVTRLKVFFRGSGAVTAIQCR